MASWSDAPQAVCSTQCPFLASLQTLQSRDLCFCLACWLSAEDIGYLSVVVCFPKV